MRSFAIVIRRAYIEAKKRRKYAKNVVVNRSVSCRSSRMPSASSFEQSLTKQIQTHQSHYVGTLSKTLYPLPSAGSTQ